jgi:hypothetical protein
MKMIKFERTITLSGEQWRSVIMGARNPMNSWSRSDSHMCGSGDCDICIDYNNCPYDHNPDKLIMGPNDHDLLMRLAKGGPVHAKYRRQIFVYADITAPLYWWKEFDTYKVGTTANSCSTMHKIHAKEFTREDFSCEDLTLIHGPDFPLGMCRSIDPLDNTIRFLNEYRRCYNEATDPAWKKRYFKQMIQLLPSSYNQMRTVTMTYENLYNMYHSRKDHKLDEWRVGFCDWVKGLPYSEVITLEEKADAQS